MFGIVFFIREFKSIDIRLNRKRIKLGFRIQKKLLNQLLKKNTKVEIRALFSKPYVRSRTSNLV